MEVPQDDDLKARAMALHAAVAAQGSATYFPTGGVFLMAPGDRSRKMIDQARQGTASGEIALEDLWHVYDKWHEMVHTSQLVTCPYVRDAAWRLLVLARLAVRRDANPESSRVSWGELCDLYGPTIAKFAPTTGDQVSAWDIFETHAVVQGLTWLTGADRTNLRWAADHLYGSIKHLPRYVWLLGVVAEGIGNDAAIALLPSLCFLSLQTPDPPRYFTAYYSRLRAEKLAAALSSSSPREICEWAGADPYRVSRSLRERKPELDNHPCMHFFRHYFDRFEALSEVEDRLDLLLRPKGEAAQEAFGPTLTVYADGEVRLSIRSDHATDDELKSALISETANALAGLELLEQHAC